MNTSGSTAIVLAMTATLSGGILNAETLTGRINGYGCAHAGSTCPIDRLDPHIALERDFVLQKPNGDYYFLTNVPRDTKVRYALEKVRVTGKLDNRYQTLVVEEFQVEQQGSFETVWTQRVQFLERSYLQGTGGLGPVVGHPLTNH